MAGIFLSYGRQDAVAAKAIACALEKSGHTVWWDPNIRGGAEFSEAIEEALNAAATGSRGRGPGLIGKCGMRLAPWRASSG